MLPLQLVEGLQQLVAGKRTGIQSTVGFCHEGQENWGQGFGEIILLDHMIQGHQRPIEAWDRLDLLFTLEQAHVDQ